MKVAPKLLADGEIRDSNTHEFLGYITSVDTLDRLFHMNTFARRAFLHAYLRGDNNGTL